MSADFPDWLLQPQAGVSMAIEIAGKFGEIIHV